MSYAAPMARRCWKHSRQKTGRPCVGRKGTVVSFPHWEQLVFVSARIGEAPPPLPPSARLALQALQRLGSFLKPLSAKNICSPAVKTNSAPHSAHFRTLSWYSIEPLSLGPERAGEWAHFAPWAWEHGGSRSRREREESLGPAGTKLQQQPKRPCLKGPDSRKCGAEPRRGGEVSPLRAAASCAVASAKALLLPGAFRRVSCRSCAS